MQQIKPFLVRVKLPITSSIIIIPVILALRENFPSIFGAESPFMPFSRIKPRITPSNFPQTMKTSAIGEFVIQVLLPFRQNDPSLCLTALVSIDPGSEPLKNNGVDTQ